SGILKHKSLMLLLVNMLGNGLISLAMKMRPHRLTSLSTLSLDEMRASSDRIVKYLSKREYK
ncbi:MAG: hypothetical protein QXI16_04680, partial [Sulfolobaceae archaeon]